jgi:hypothetical protein
MKKSKRMIRNSLKTNMECGKARRELASAVREALSSTFQMKKLNPIN